MNRNYTRRGFLKVGALTFLAPSIALVGCARTQEQVGLINKRKNRRKSPWYMYSHPNLDFEIEVAGGGGILHAYLKTEKPDSNREPIFSFTCDKKEKIEKIVIGDLDYDGKMDIMFTTKKYDPKFSGWYNPRVRQLENIKSWEWEKRFIRRIELEDIAEKSNGTWVLISRNREIVGVIPLEDFLKKLPKPLDIPEMPMPRKMQRYNPYSIT